jgi:hypothetical protein
VLSFRVLTGVGPGARGMAETEGDSLNALFEALADCEEQLKPFRHELFPEDEADKTEIRGLEP